MNIVRLSLILAVTFAASVSTVSAGTASPRVVIMSLDGAGARLVETMMASGHLPELSRLTSSGAVADHARTNFVSQTAAGHAALWTGCFGNINGISGNQVPLLPRQTHTILENQAGFSSRALLAEPLFVSAARAGKRVIALNATHTTPLDVYQPGGRFGEGLGDRLSIVTGYGTPAAKSQPVHPLAPCQPVSGWPDALPDSEAPVLLGAMTIQRDRFDVLVSADPHDPCPGYDTLSVYANRNRAHCLARLKPVSGTEPAQFSPALQLSDGQSTLLGVVSLRPDGQDWQLYHTPLEGYLTNAGPLKHRIEAGGGEFLRGGAATSYAQGQFGKTLVEGGDGRAEQIYLATVRLAIAQATRALNAAADSPEWDLLLGYLPFPDEVEHLWYGYITPGTPAYRRQLAAKLTAHLAQVFEDIDNLLTQLKRRAGSHANLMVVSDHGMVPAAWDFNPNVVLKQAGLLTLTANGDIDLARTQAMYSSTNGGYVIVNAKAFKGGIVPPEQVATVANRAARALQSVTIRSGLGAIPVVRNTVIMPDAKFAEQYGAGGDLGGDVYLDLIPGFYPNPNPAGTHLFTRRPPNRSGGHMFDARRPELYAIFYANGPAFRPGATSAGIRNIDVAPTAARILGIPAPRSSRGRVLDELLINPQVAAPTVRCPSPIQSLKGAASDSSRERDSMKWYWSACLDCFRQCGCRQATRRLV